MAANRQPLKRHSTYEDGLRDGERRERAAIIRYLRSVLLPERAKMIERGDHHA